VISARLGGAGDLHLFAPVRGLASQVPLLLAALEGAPPSVVGLGISPEELKGLLDYFVNASAEPIVPLTTAERSEVRGLVRFGEGRVPNPSFVELLRWAREIPVEALDPTEDRTANLFADHIGYIELVRRTVRERRVSRTPPAPTTPDEYALEWDRTVAGGRGSRNFAAARDRHLVRAARLLATRHARVAVVIDRERFDSVKSLFAAPDPGRLDPD